MYACLDERGEIENNEDEATDDDDAGEEHALGDEDHENDVEDDGEGGDGDYEGEEPGTEVWLAGCSRRNWK